MATISGKVKGMRLEWFGHVGRRQLEYACRQIIAMEPPGKRKRGRPRPMWMDTVDRRHEQRGTGKKDGG